MTLALGCIADDYTGASDLANMLTRCGLRTVQTIGVPDDALALPDVDAVVVSLKSRSIESSRAVARSREADARRPGERSRPAAGHTCTAGQLQPMQADATPPFSVRCWGTHVRG